MNFKLSFLSIILLFFCYISSNSQSLVISNDGNGYVEYDIVGLEDGSHVFTLFGDGTFSTLNSPKHNFEIKDSAYESEVFIAKSYDPVIPLVLSDDVIIDGDGSDFINPLIAMDGDIDIMTSWAVATGFSNYFIIAFKNTTSLSPISGDVAIHYNSSQLIFDTSAVKEYNDWVYDMTNPASLLIGKDKKLNWKFENLAYNETRYIYVPGEVNLGVALGLDLIATYNVLGGKQGEPIERATANTFKVQRTPHDPNFKIVDKDCLLPNLAGQKLKYTIGFFNDGNDFVSDVLVKDNLSDQFELSSFTFLEYEYLPIISWDDHDVSFAFNGINLPGTNQSIPTIYSYDKCFTSFSFSICTQSSLFYGDCIQNDAEITFVDQPTFVTDPAIVCASQCTIFEMCTSGSSTKPSFYEYEKNNSIKLNVYPNPTKESLFIDVNLSSEFIVDISIYNLEGKRVKLINRKNEKTQAFNKKINVEDLMEGMYYILIKTDFNVYSQKIIIK